MIDQTALHSLWYHHKLLSLSGARGHLSATIIRPRYVTHLRCMQAASNKKKRHNLCTP